MPGPLPACAIRTAFSPLEGVHPPAAYRACGALLDRDLPLRLQGLVAVEHGVPCLEVRLAAAVEPAP